MPIIRSHAKAAVASPELKAAIQEQLIKELSGEFTPDGPVIFEIPFDGRGRIDVLVIWDAWEDVDFSDRSDIILYAYQTVTKAHIAQAMGFTYEEALVDRVLPYAVVPKVRADVDEGELKAAMLAEGGFVRDSGKVSLRFPTMLMAEAAHERLVETLPKGYWSITQAPSYPD